ncbi:alpha/beta hydrolase [Franzmannia qiaohouensis]|uniref:Alpha/beta-hydrolase family protein n=1 Tax=Franzmannia qiaohouensis TaxID=1329370 RepID=A0ABU1HC85_9GAMM|nr:alpha/beta-hydrolase family protein [Halomonas qiaohouensis]MDR5905088.1 alpha/beta-hydrolase family protein [Halomonas qiaohouensis]
MQVLRQFSALGLLMGTLFFAISLTPSLLPRTFIVQGIISGLSFSAGYGLGVMGRWLWAYLELPVPGRRGALSLKRIAAGICAVVASVFLWRASGWQDSIRVLMEMEPASGTRPFSVALIAVAIFAALLLLARLFRRTFRFLARRLRRYVPRRVSNVIGVVAAAALFWSVIDGIIFTLTLRALDRSYQQVDVLMPDDLAPPGDPQVAGSEASLISWEALGLRGRRFVTAGPSADDIERFLGEPAEQPLRVYVGLNAAETPKQRAQLALEELKRVGAFERSLLLLATPTGRGWLDPAAQNTLEYLQRGDIATVTAQYSYLPSPLALIVEGDYGAEMARALFDEVYRHWTTLPDDQRPALYLHGLSLGALNSDRSFDLYDIIDDPFDGALWSGPPFRSPTWRALTEDRDAGSPAWLPRFRGGAVVRFMNQHGGLGDGAVEWGDFRIAYLQYASDPVTFFEPGALYREPEWLQAPRGPDVSEDLTWYPVVTGLQLLADLAAGSAPPGYGHEIAAEDYIEAWLALVEPDAWSADDVERLKALFAPRR